MTETNEDKEEERGRIICMLSTTPAHVDSVEVNCIDCGVALWRSVRSLEQDLDPMCPSCVPADTRPQAAVPQIIEVAETMGVTPLELANYIASLGIEIV